MVFNYLNRENRSHASRFARGRREFYVDGLGMIETESDENHIYLRGLEEHSHHSLLLKKADKAVVEVLSYKVERNTNS